MEKEIDGAIKTQLNNLKRREIIDENLKNFVVVLVKNVDEAAQFADRYASEHLEIMTDDPDRIVNKINTNCFIKS